MSNTFSSFSFGCRVNQAEKEELDRQLTALGYRVNHEDPGIFIINSCSVTHKAEREAKQLIYQVKRKNPEVKVVVTGCAATNWMKTKEEIPEIDLLVDNQNKQYLASLIAKRYGKKGVIASETKQSHSIGIATSPTAPRNDMLVPDKYTKSGRMILKIQDGCHRFCTYCIVPYLRGLPKSMPPEDIISAVNRYEGQLKEVILAAINTEAYGYDTKISFVELVQRVLDSTSVQRVSFGSIHPWSVNDEFFEFFSRVQPSGRLVNFFHIPLQSGCNKILQIMKRGYTREEFVEKLQKLNSLKSHIFIATDVIVGYLEETDADFEDTYNFLKESPISKFHIFRYSEREHTAAHYLGKRLKEPTPQEKLKRAKALAELNKEKYEKFLLSHESHTFPALFLEKEKDGYREALLNNQVPVKVKTSKDLTGQIKNVKVTTFNKGILLATLS